MTMMMKRTSLLILWTSLPFFSVAQDCEPCAFNEKPSSFGKSPIFNCKNATEVTTQAYGNGTEDCRNSQLMLYQQGCCPDPPSGHCTLCSTYNEAKIVPPFVHQEFGSQTIDVTCKNVAENDWKYLEPSGVGSQYGSCGDTERGRARAWCECNGITPHCELKCPDGSEIPDPKKEDPLFGETCERWQFETTALTSTACDNMEENLFFHAQKFCCNLDPPSTCSICPAGQKMKVSDEKNLINDKFSCNDIAEYIKWLPGDNCIGWFSKRMDDPNLDTLAYCCEPDGSSTGTDSASAVETMTTTVMSFVFLVVLAAF